MPFDGNAAKRVGDKSKGCPATKEWVIIYFSILLYAPL
tara:strand:+ start:702 stop:815 length:114 start_codon:yes stop_codon:yes gene_type:complete